MALDLACYGRLIEPGKGCDIGALTQSYYAMNLLRSEEHQKTYDLVHAGRINAFGAIQDSKLRTILESPEKHAD